MRLQWMEFKKIHQSTIATSSCDILYPPSPPLDQRGCYACCKRGWYIRSKNQVYPISANVISDDLIGPKSKEFSSDWPKTDCYECVKVAENRRICVLHIRPFGTDNDGKVQYPSKISDDLMLNSEKLNQLYTNLVSESQITKNNSGIPNYHTAESVNQSINQSINHAKSINDGNLLDENNNLKHASTFPDYFSKKSLAERSIVGDSAALATSRSLSPKVSTLWSTASMHQLLEQGAPSEGSCKKRSRSLSNDSSSTEEGLNKDSRVLTVAVELNTQHPPPSDLGHSGGAEGSAPESRDLGGSVKTVNTEIKENDPLSEQHLSAPLGGAGRKGTLASLPDIPISTTRQKLQQKIRRVRWNLRNKKKRKSKATSPSPSENPNPAANQVQPSTQKSNSAESSDKNSGYLNHSKHKLNINTITSDKIKTSDKFSESVNQSNLQGLSESNSVSIKVSERSSTQESMDKIETISQQSESVEKNFENRTICGRITSLSGNPRPNSIESSTVHSSPRRLSEQRRAPSATARSTFGEVMLNTELSCHGARPVLFFVHGVGGCSLMWRHQIDYFVDAGYEVVSVDLPGHGRSPPAGSSKEYSFSSLKNDILNIFDKFARETNIVIAHSYGTCFAAILARERSAQLSHLVLLNCGAPVPLAVEASAIFKLPSPFLMVLRPFIDAEFAKKAFKRKPTFEELECCFGVSSKTLKRTILGQQWDEGDWAFYRLIETPTLLVYGTEDGFVSLEEMLDMQKALQRCQLEVIDRASHMVMLEQPDSVSNIIHRFIQLRPQPLSINNLINAESQIIDGDGASTRNRGAPRDGAPALMSTQVPEMMHRNNKIMRQSSSGNYKMFPGLGLDIIGSKFNARQSLS